MPERVECREVDAWVVRGSFVLCTANLDAWDVCMCRGCSEREHVYTKRSQGSVSTHSLVLISGPSLTGACGDLRPLLRRLSWLVRYVVRQAKHACGNSAES